MAGRERVGLATVGIDVKGLREFQRELRKAKLTKELSAAHQRVGLIVQAAAAANAHAQPSRAGKYVATTIKSRRLARAVAIDFGGPGGTARYPGVHQTAAILEFGTKKAAYRARKFRAWVGNQYSDVKWSGYIVGTAVNDNREQIINTYAAEIQKVAASAFPDA
jgi:hypothetical protein